MAVFITGLISVIVCYVMILAIGIWAGRKQRNTDNSDDIFVANRSFGLWVAFFTITATNIGGGYINGSAEMMYLRGFLWTQAPLAFGISILIVGLFFAPKVRRGNYVTIFDPFQTKYGNKLGVLVFIPQLLGDLFWNASILSALGASLSIILDINGTIAIIVSASVAVGYTFIGGLYSVAYTDVIQMAFIFFGLVIALPFTLTHEAVDLDKLTVNATWRGEIETRELGVYIDGFLLLIGGGLPWQEHHQRVLACKTPNIARWATATAGVACAIQAIPPIAIGAAVAATNWNMTSYNGTVPIPDDQSGLVLPLALQYLCPTVVSIIGLGAVSAAVMSSSDSCVLSTGSVFTHNIYSIILRPQASKREKTWVLRISVLVSGALGTLIAISVTSIYGLFFLCADLMYVINSPQLVCVLWITMSNAYGYLVGYMVSFSLRIAAGEPLLGFPPLIRYPGYDETLGQLFPFRSFAMITGFSLTLIVSYITNQLFLREILPKRFDFLHCVTNVDPDARKPVFRTDKQRRNDAKKAEEIVPLS